MEDLSGEVGYYVTAWTWNRGRWVSCRAEVRCGRGSQEESARIFIAMIDYKG